jgi:DNA mismatch repair protein MutS2
VTASLHDITWQSLEWGQLAAALRFRLRTGYGHRAMESLAPLPDAGSVRESLRRIAELWALESEQGPLDFGAVRDLDELMDRAEKGGRLEAPELLAVLGTQECAHTLAKRLRRSAESPLLSQAADRLEFLNALCATLSRSITPDGELSEHTFPELAELRQEVSRRRDAIHERLERLLRARSLQPMLQEPIYSVRGSRYVVPLKADFKGQLPGIVHDVSASGLTLFVEPQSIVDETNNLLLAERRYAFEVDAILRRLTAEAGEAAPAIRRNLAWLGELDLLAGQARLGRDYQGTVPEVGEGERIALNGLAHPLMLLEGQDVVRNDVALGGETRCLIVSGANTGGKTVLLKSAGLSLLLVAHGMPVPALSGSRCDFFPRVAADVGDQQDLAQSLSTFSARIRTLSEIRRIAGPGTVILIDEILTGTEPQHGAALAAAALEELAACGALCLATTHYGELKALPAALPGFANASVTFDLERLQPTFRLRVGIPGASYAFSIARRHGLDEAIVAGAERRLAEGGISADALLEQLQEQERKFQEREQLFAQEAGRLREQESRLDQREARMAERERELRRRERGRLGAELESARQEVSETLRRLREATSAAEAAAARERIRAVETRVREQLSEPAPEKAKAAAPFDPASATPGQTVYVASLQRTATLEEILDGGRSARLRAGAVTLELPASELSVPPGEPVSKRPARKEMHRPGPAQGATVAAEGNGRDIHLILPTEENTLDLRGLDLASALERTERFLDLCVVKHISPVLLIHGHGTGRLKSGLREKLGESAYVLAFRPGERREGGDGVTVVALKL